MNILTTVLKWPYRWFSNVVALREKRGMSYTALFAVICFVSFTRAELEILTTRTARFSSLSVLYNAAFYLQSAYVYAFLASWLDGKYIHIVISTTQQRRMRQQNT